MSPGAKTAKPINVNGEQSNVDHCLLISILKVSKPANSAHRTTPFSTKQHISIVKRGAVEQVIIDFVVETGG